MTFVMPALPPDIWNLIIDEVASLPDGSAESWSVRITGLARLARVCKATEVSHRDSIYNERPGL